MSYDKTYEPCSCGCGSSADCNCDCNECPPLNCLEQAIRDALAELQKELEALVQRAEDAANHSEAAAGASAQSAAEAKEYRDEAELASSSATKALAVITDTAKILQETSDTLKQIADQVKTAIAGIAVRTWFYTTVTEGQTHFQLPESLGAMAVQYIVIDGARQDLQRGFDYDFATRTVTLAEGLPKGKEITLVLGTYNADNPMDFAGILATYNGANMIGATSGKTVQQYLDNLDDPADGGRSSVVTWHDQEISEDVTIPANKNAYSAGPTIQINQNVTVDVGDNSNWIII